MNLFAHRDQVESVTSMDLKQVPDRCAEFAHLVYLLQAPEAGYCVRRSSSFAWRILSLDGWSGGTFEIISSKAEELEAVEIYQTGMYFITSLWQMVKHTFYQLQILRNWHFMNEMRCLGCHLSNCHAFSYLSFTRVYLSSIICK